MNRKSDKKVCAVENVKEYRKNKGKYLPLIDHETEIFEKITDYGDCYDINIGWDCGFIDNRPYFLECWSTDSVTMITIYLSTIGIEYTIKDLEKLIIEDTGIFKKKQGYREPRVEKCVDENNNEFFAINVMVGMPDEPALIDGAYITSFDKLNDLNRKK